MRDEPQLPALPTASPLESDHLYSGEKREPALDGSTTHIPPAPLDWASLTTQRLSGDGGGGGDPKPSSRGRRSPTKTRTRSSRGEAGGDRGRHTRAAGGFDVRKRWKARSLVPSGPQPGRRRHCCRRRRGSVKAAAPPCRRRRRSLRGRGSSGTRAPSPPVAPVLRRRCPWRRSPARRALQGPTCRPGYWSRWEDASRP